MSDMMDFPKTVEEFMEMYKMVDTDEVYSNKTEYVPIFRMKQWFEHVGNSDTLEWIPCSERLPEIDEEVLVYLFGDSPHLAWFDGLEWQTEDFTVDDDERPIAWMRLPKPWKGEKDD